VPFSEAMADFGFDKTIGNLKQTLYLMIPCHIG
jgi:DNA-binding transcriptional regulator GbsR (MarR family)